MTGKAYQYLTTVGKCTVIQGLDEEAIAMLFGRFSRNPKGLKDSLQEMMDKGQLKAAPFVLSEMGARVKKFHESITIGYNHKSVGDHAMVHFALEGVSAIAERDWLSARLLAGSSKSTRYVNFKDAGFHTPVEWPAALVQEYERHCTALIDAYEQLVPLAESAVRDIVPFDESASKIWRNKKAWESATGKRALDMVRDLLPMSIRTNYAITCSATALREMCEKRSHSAGAEIGSLANETRLASRSVIPTLMPGDQRKIKRYPMKEPQWSDERIHVPMKVQLVNKPSWRGVEILTGYSTTELIYRWTNDRTKHMGPDRTAETAIYSFVVHMPMAIHRDLGRQRMMTQLRGALTPAMGYGVDPLLGDATLYLRNPKLAIVARAHQNALQQADERLRSWIGSVPTVALQYACPLATMVPVTWVLNVRELVYILGLRTSPQGHPAYRKLVQMIADAVRRSDPMMRGLVAATTDFDNVIVGRPG